MRFGRGVSTMVGGAARETYRYAACSGSTGLPIFSAPHLAQVLVNSLRKVVRSALEQRRVEFYVSARVSLPRSSSLIETIAGLCRTWPTAAGIPRELAVQSPSARLTGNLRCRHGQELPRNGVIEKGGTGRVAT